MSSKIPNWLVQRRPTAGIPGQLKSPAGQTLSVTIAPRLEEILLILHVPISAALDEPGGDLLLESITSRGLVRLRGQIEMLSEDLARFRMHGEPELIQRRDFVRVTALASVELDDFCGLTIEAQCINLSGGGMLVSTRHPFQEQDDLRLTISFGSNDAPVTVIGRVVRVEQERLGVQFLTITPKDRQRLIRFIFDRQRRALAVARGDAV